VLHIQRLGADKLEINTLANIVRFLLPIYPALLARLIFIEVLGGQPFFGLAM
jgi:hypothetical protein